MVKGRSRTTGLDRLRREQSLHESVTGLRGPDGRFIAGGSAVPSAVVVVETRQQRRYAARMAAKGAPALRQQPGAGVEPGSSGGVSTHDDYEGDTV